MSNKSVDDMLYVGVDFSQNDTDMMMVMRSKGDKTHIINLLKDEEARQVYNKLIGVKKVYVRHTFEFRTEEDWKPMTSACWVDCPFSFMIGLGKSCKCLDENNELECPFVGNCYDGI